MTRHERRKAARARKNAKADRLNARAMQVLKAEKLKLNLVERMPFRSPKGLGNQRIYSGVGLIPMKGYGTGAFKPDGLTLSDRGLIHLQSQHGKPKA
jgi:hypothetical protein